MDAVRQHEIEHAQAERARLLYVAATRARDHLVVSLLHPQRSTGSDAARLLQAGAAEDVATLPPVAVPQGAVDGLAGLQVEAPDVNEYTLEAGRLRLIAASKTRTYTSATAMGREQEAVKDEKAEQRHDETEPWTRGRAASHRGRAVHAALQGLDWDAGDEEIEAIARAEAVAEAIPEQAEQVRLLIKNALLTKAADRARAARRALREVPFALRQDNVVIEGFIDLLIEDADGNLEIVDWKTDGISDAELPGRLQEYTLQAGLYVLGLEAAIERPISKVTFVFVSRGREATHDEPSALAAAAREELRLTPANQGGSGA